MGTASVWASMSAASVGLTGCVVLRLPWTHAFLLVFCKVAPLLVKPFTWVAALWILAAFLELECLVYGMLPGLFIAFLVAWCQLCMSIAALWMVGFSWMGDSLGMA